MSIRVDLAAVERLAQGDAAVRLLLNTGRKVRNAAIRLAPVDGGRLRASITVESAEEQGGPVVYVGTNVRYAVPVHEGVSARSVTVRGHARRGGAVRSYRRGQRARAGRPFLRDALVQVLGQGQVSG